MGVRETIFESDHFADTQLIVTCHSNEFIKDIQQHLPARRRNDCQLYLFRNHTGSYQPRVSGNVAIRNYVAKARAAKDNLDNWDALQCQRMTVVGRYYSFSRTGPVSATSLKQPDTPSPK